MSIKRIVMAKLMAVGLLTCALLLATGCSSTSAGWQDTFDGMESDSGPDREARLDREDRDLA